MTLSCKKAVTLASDDLERPLSPREKLSLRFHLAICSACRRYRRQILGLTSLLRNRGQHLSEQPPPAEPPLSPEAKERLSQAIRDRLPPS